MLRDEIHRILKHGVRGDATTADYVDAILNLPEIQQMMKAEKFILDCLIAVRLKDGVGEVDILGKVQKWKENSDKWEAMNGTETQAAWDAACYNQRRAERAERQLNLPELKKLQEKAALYDEVLHLKDIFMRWKKGRDLILEGLIVEEKCQHPRDGISMYGIRFCAKCHGTGTLTRPAIPEEVREVLEIVLSSDGFSGYFRLVQNQEWRLKSGAVLKLKERVS